jgi:hypothetical protein
MMGVGDKLLGVFDGPASGDPRRTGRAYARAYFEAALPASEFVPVMATVERNILNDTLGGKAHPSGVDMRLALLYMRLFARAALFEYQRLTGASQHEGGHA